MQKSLRLNAMVFALLVTFTLGPSSFAQTPQRFEQVLIQAPRPHTKVLSDIRALGGRVKKEYKNIDVISAEIPSTAVGDLRVLVGPEAVSKDIFVPAPRAVDPAHGRSGLQGAPVRSLRFGSLATSSAIPTGFNPYVLNTAGMNLEDVAKTGAGIIVAVIDSGLRPGYPHIAGSVIQCENFVDDDRNGTLDGACSSSSNDPHGTFVAGMIAAHAEFDLTGTPLLTSIQTHLPSALKKNSSGQKTILPLTGSAPGAKIYAFRVFAPGVGAPESRIIDAIDRVIELRKSGVKIQICNLSLGNATLFAGRDAFDKAVDKLLENDIVPVVSAGNVGPSSLTISSPSSSFSALGVGASSPSANERIYWDIFEGPGAGIQNRPFKGTQTANFSSRGPNADGRLDPDVVASGFANFGQGYGTPSEVDIAGGTSFSAPLAAGVAAVLRQAHPGATATQIRNAIISTANPRLIEDGSGVLDRGEGLVDAKAASRLLATGLVPDFLPHPDRPDSDVRVNVERGADLDVLHGTVRKNTGRLKPGERFEILYDVVEKTDQVTVTISNFAASGNQNPSFGDGLILTIHSAKTSAIHDLGDYLFFEFGVFDDTFTVDDPETGIMRITVNGDWFNLGNVSADVTVTSTREPLPRISADGRIKDGDFVIFPIDIPKGTTRADFRMGWKDDWSHYPTSDVDMLIVQPDGSLVAVCALVPTAPICLYDPDDATNTKPGAGLDVPEKASLRFPATGAAQKETWYVYAFGFDVPAGTDKVELRVTDQNGKLLK